MRVIFARDKSNFPARITTHFPILPFEVSRQVLAFSIKKIYITPMRDAQPLT